MLHSTYSSSGLEEQEQREVRRQVPGSRAHETQLLVAHATSRLQCRQLAGTPGGFRVSGLRWGDIQGYSMVRGIGIQCADMYEYVYGSFPK